MAQRNTQVSRIYRILNILEKAPQGLSVTDLCERLHNRDFQVGKRTVYRDLEALRAAGFPLDEKGKDLTNGTRWVLEKNSSLSHYLILKPKELIALYLSQKIMLSFKNTPFFKDIETIFQKIEDKMTKKSLAFLNEVSQEIHINTDIQWGLGLQPKVFDTVRAACSEQHQLKIIYASSHSQTTRERHLGPQFIYFSKGSFYLIAEDLESQTQKTFSLTRVQQAEMLEKTYESDHIDPEMYFHTVFGIYHSQNSIEENIVLEFDSSVAQYITERRWHHSQKIIENNTHRTRISLSVAVTPELTQWVLSFGHHAKVLSPLRLREEITQKAEEIINMYKKTQKVS